MLVQGGHQLLSKQDFSGKAKNAQKDKKDVFEDILANAERKKSRSKKMTPKKAAPKKQTRNDDVAEDQHKQKQALNNKKKLNAENPRKTKSIQADSSKQNHMRNAENKQSQANKKFNLQGNFKAETDASLNQSELQLNTLDNNKKLVNDLDKDFQAFQRQMDELKLAQMQKKSGEKTALGKINPMMNNSKSLQNNGGKIELDNSFKAETSMDTLAIGGLTEGKDLSFEQKASDSGSESSTQFDNLMSQILEQDNGSQQVEGNFAEELAIGQDQGKSDKIENMNSIIKQARAIVKDGGGEMQIHLQPEGLGKVQLKVAVNDGQVNVEMMADNAAAKKALEDGLVDIKQALEGQKLLVETLKVEMSQDYQKDFSDLANHMQEQANRDFAEQFLGQFRQERDERFGGMVDVFRNFQPGPKEEDLSLVRQNMYADKGKGRSVNLVA